MFVSIMSRLAFDDLDVVVAGTKTPQVILGLATAARATLLKGINAPTTVVKISADCVYVVIVTRTLVVETAEANVI